MVGMKPSRQTPARSARARTIDSSQSYRNASKGAGLGRILSQIAVFAPIALEAAVYLRGQQKAKRGKYHKASTKGKAFDFMLERAHKRYGKTQKGKKGWF